MIDINWKPLKEEFKIWQDKGLCLPFWWRDDDAVEPTPALERLAAVSADFNSPVHLAIVPKYAKPELSHYISATPALTPVVHGWAHKNHAPADQKKCEFGLTRSFQECREDMDQALRQMKKLFGAQLNNMFVPPWNRIRPDLIPYLSSDGYKSISTYGPRASQFAASDVLQVNTHLDPIAWHHSRSLEAPDILIQHTVQLMQNRRLNVTDNTEPLGLLTHHLIHDDTVWHFIEQFLVVLREGPVEIFTML